MSVTLSLSLLWLGPRVTDEISEVKLLWVVEEDCDAKDLVVGCCWPADVSIVVEDELWMVSVVQLEGLLLRPEEEEELQED